MSGQSGGVSERLANPLPSKFHEVGDKLQDAAMIVTGDLFIRYPHVFQLGPVSMISKPMFFVQTHLPPTDSFSPT